MLVENKITSGEEPSSLLNFDAPLTLQGVHTCKKEYYILCFVIIRKHNIYIKIIPNLRVFALSRGNLINHNKMRLML